MDKYLRLFVGQVVVESKLSKEAKLQMLNFIKEEASDAQIKALILDGKIVHLDEQAEEIVNERFKSHRLNEAGTAVNTLMAMLPGLNFLWVAWRSLASIYSDAHRKCGTYKISKDRDACIAKARIQFADKRIDLLKKAESKCATAKNPKRCQSLVTGYIAKELSNKKKQEAKLNNLVMKNRGYSGEPGDIVATRV